MIKITFERYDGFGRCGKPVLQERKVGNAISYFIDCELAFGGSVVLVTENKVVTKTNVLGSVDVTSFEGDPIEIAPLLHCAVVTEIIRKDSLFTDAGMDGLMRITKGNPGLIAMGGEFFLNLGIGKALYTSLIVHAICAKQGKLETITNADHADKFYKEPEVAAVLEKLKNASTKDLAAVIMLFFDDEIDIMEALSLM